MSMGHSILKNLWQDDKGKDLSFIVDAKAVRCHRCIVQNASPYFKKLLTLDFAEGSKCDITIDVISHETFYSIIKYFYTDEICLSDTNVWDFMKAAERFLIETLNEICMEYIEGHMAPESCWSLLAFTRVYKWKEEDNKPIALRYIAKHPSKCELQESTESFSMSEWKFMVETAISEEMYTSEDNDAFLRKLLMCVEDESLASVDGVLEIPDVLEKAVPLFDSFVKYDNALKIYSLSQRYGCGNLRRIAVESLRNIRLSKYFLCSIDKLLFDSVIDDLCNLNLKSSSRFASECGDVILTWLRQNNTDQNHILTLFTKYSHQLSKTICEENVFNIFRMARSCGSAFIENVCLSFIDQNMTNLIDSLLYTTGEEIKRIAHFHADTQCKDVDGIHKIKVQCFETLVEKESFVEENVFTSLESFLDKWDDTALMSEKRQEEMLQSERSSSECSIKNFVSANLKINSKSKSECIKEEGKTEKDNDISQNEGKLDESVGCEQQPTALGKVLISWIVRNEKLTHHEKDIDCLIQNNYVDLASNFSSENIETMYTLALKRNQRGLESHCFSYILANFKDSVNFILNLPFQHFSSLLISISKLYKDNIRVKCILGKMVTCWMAPISNNFRYYADRELGFDDVSKLSKRVNLLGKVVVFGKLGFLIEAMLEEMLSDTRLVISLKISAKLHNRKVYRIIQERCIRRFNMFVKDGQFISLPAQELGEIIKCHKEQNSTTEKEPTGFFLPGIEIARYTFPMEETYPSEDRKMNAVIYWYESFRTSCYAPNATHQERRENFMELFSLLDLDEISMERLLDVFDDCPFLLENKFVCKNFLRSCRKQFNQHLRDKYLERHFLNIFSASSNIST